MASIPDFVFDMCRTYQHDHALFVTWLGEQAAKCNLYPAAKTRINTKKNGKARSGIKYTLSLKEYIPFAKAIIESTPLVKIPSTIFRGLQRTIAKRRECAAWYSHFAPDNGHLHMIQVLEETRDILRAKIEVPENGGSSLRAGDNDPRHPSTNIFDRLYDLKEIDEDITDIETGDLTSRALILAGEGHSIVFEAESLDGDSYFHLFCFFKDCNRLRRYLNRLWIDYRKGKVDLITASVTTDTAIGLLQEADEQFMLSFQQPQDKNSRSATGYQAAGIVLYEHICRLNGQTSFYVRSGGLEIRDDTFEQASFVCLTTYALMKEYLDMQSCYKELHILDLDEVGLAVDLNADRARLQVDQKVEEDRIILLDILPDIKCLELHLMRVWPAEDKFTQGFRDATRTNVLPTWLVFAGQIFLDIYHIMRPDIARGFSELNKAADLAVKSIQAEIKHAQRYRTAHTDNIQDIAFMALKLVTQYIRKDLVAELYKYFGFDSSTEFDHQIKRKPFNFLSSHPVLCGLMAFRWKLLVQDVGIGLDFASGVLISTAHLYNAARQQSLCEVWDDMEVMIKHHGESKIFIGKRPTKSEEFFRCFRLVLGCSAQEFVPDGKARAFRMRAGRTLQMRSEGKRKLENPSAVAKVFLYIYNLEYANFWGIKDRDFGLHDVKLLVQMSAETHRAAESPSKCADIMKSFSTRTEWLSLAKSSKSRNLTPTQFLDTLRSTLMAEQASLNFDYVSMHLRCQRLLRQVCKSCAEPLQRGYKTCTNFDLPQNLFAVTELLLKFNEDADVKKEVVTKVKTKVMRKAKEFEARNEAEEEALKNWKRTINDFAFDDSEVNYMEDAAKILAEILREEGDAEARALRHNK